MEDCKKINDMKNELLAITKVTPFDKEKFKQFLDKYNIKYDTKQITKISNDCESLIGNLGVNYIGNSPECVKAINDTCHSLFADKDQIRQCKWNLAPGFSNITQTNKAEVSNQCYLSAADKVLMQDNDEKFAIALQSAIGNVPDIDCSKLNVKGSYTDHYKNINRCISSGLTAQRNIIKSCSGASNVVQSNYSKCIQECIMGGASSLSPKDILNPAQQATLVQQKMSSKSWYLIAGIICLVTLIIITITIIIIRRSKKK